MRLNPETLRFIFGLKLRTLRQEKALSLKTLARQSGLSPSYINEIEKGKKYPKGDKILILAETLGVGYEDLTSLKLTSELNAVSKVLEKNLLNGLPYDIFGIPSQLLLEVMAEHPQKFGALVGTLLDLARNFQISVEDFFAAALRAHLDGHDNYFPELEESVDEFKNKFVGDSGEDFLKIDRLKEFLQKNHRYEIVERSFDDFANEIRDLYFFVKPGKITRFTLNEKLGEKEKRFILVREIAYAYLNLKDRFLSFRVGPVDSFDQIYNNFKASYFASAFLLPAEEFKERVSGFFAKDRWDETSFLEWIESYPCPVESFFHRFLQLLPTFFDLGQMFFLKFSYDPANKDLQLERELHLSELHGPHQVTSFEHYCRRWVTTELLISTAEKNADGLQSRVQRSKFIADQVEYLCFAVARRKELHSGRWECYNLGIAVDERLTEKVRFLRDPSIKAKQVGTSCQQCQIPDCAERAAPSRLQKKKQNEKFVEALKDVLAKTRG